MKLKTQTYGDGKQDIVILHGLLGSARNWHSIAQELSAKLDARVRVPSLRNHGESPHGDHSVPLMRDDISELLEQQSINQPILLGHSMGGLVAMAFAVQYPDKLKGVIAADVGPVVQLEQMADVLKAMQELDLTKVKRRHDADRQLAKRIGERAVRQFLLQNLARASDGSYYWQCNLPELLRFVQQESGEILKPDEKYAGPALFVGGGRSQHNLQEQSSRIRQHFPNMALSMIPDAAHWVHFDAPESFVELVVSFVRENAG